ncbi:MAG: PBSX family phage terminase large subunit [Clostridia bacterium]|nr:PBSX family phage terminase large subunit [Clostridia bacterium]
MVPSLFSEVRAGGVVCGGPGSLPYCFGEKHVAYMRRALDCTLNVAEGAVRSGKTVDNLFVFAHFLEGTSDHLHLATGATAITAKVTLGDGGGFGLEAIFRGRCRWGKYLGCEALRIQTPTGEKTVLFVGGKNADSYKHIRGLSIGMWLATEINLHHPSFIREAFSRQLAAAERRIFWDLNPDAPGAPIYRDFLDRYASMTAAGTLSADFYNHAHFTIFDNAAIPRERLADILAQYEPGSVWYRRDIDGIRCAAEGMVYTRFAEDPDAFLIEQSEVPPLAFASVGVDFGGNRSKTAFVACGFSPGFSDLYALSASHLRQGVREITSEEVNAAAISFLAELHSRFPGVPVRYMFCDSEAQYLIGGLRRALHADPRPYIRSVSVQNSQKKPISERILCENSMIASHRLHLVRGTTDVLCAGLCGAMWDPGAAGDIRMDNFSSDIDILDAFEYAFEGYLQKLR